MRRAGNANYCKGKQKFTIIISPINIDLWQKIKYVAPRNNADAQNSSDEKS